VISITHQRDGAHTLPYNCNTLRVEANESCVRTRLIPAACLPAIWWQSSHCLATTDDQFGWDQLGRGGHAEPHHGHGRHVALQCVGDGKFLASGPQLHLGVSPDPELVESSTSNLFSKYADEFCTGCVDGASASTIQHVRTSAEREGESP